MPTLYRYTFESAQEIKKSNSLRNNKDIKIGVCPNYKDSCLKKGIYLTHYLCDTTGRWLSYNTCATQLNIH